MKSKYSSIIPQLEEKHIISYEDSSINIDEINKYARNYPNDIILVEVTNTKGITSSLLRKLEENVCIRIAGAYDYERINAQKGVIFNNKNGKRRAIEYYYGSVIYDKNEAITILEEIEEIEKGMNSNWSDIQKLVYLYTILKRKITYDPKYEYKTDEEIRSLRGLITKNTVCAGYSLILKEFLDRQNIKCLWVGGEGHAWNIVEIDGKLYPVDLTYENKKFRSGIQESYSFLGQDKDKFNRKHRPAKNDPNNGYQNKLHEFDKNLIKAVASTVILEERYEQISYRFERPNKEQFVLMQIDTRKSNDETYYIYYYDRIENNKIANKPLILASKETISNFVDNIKFDRDNILKCDDISEKLFSEQNINDSLSRYSLYVGEFDNYQMTRDHVNILRKKEKDLKAFKIPPKVYPRKDGSTLVVEKAILEPIVLGNTVAYKYNIYDVIYEEDRPILRKRVIYSDTDFIYSNIQEIQYVLLDEKNIADAIKNRSGYIGYINEFGDVTHSMALSMFFSKRSNFTIEDFERMNKHTR